MKTKMRREFDFYNFVFTQILMNGCKCYEPNQTLCDVKLVLENRRHVLIHLLMKKLLLSKHTLLLS